MSALQGLWHRLRVRLLGEQYAQEQEAEIEFHLALEQMHQQHAGASAGDSRDAARRRFGNPTAVREEARRAAGFGPIDRLRQDLSYAWRTWQRSPGLAITIILTFALGVGANAAIFSFLDRFLLRSPTAVVDPDHVYRLRHTHPRRGSPGEYFVVDRFSFPEYEALRDGLRGRARVAAIVGADSIAFDRGGATVSGRREYVTAEFLPMLVGRPALGRFFTPDEDNVEAPSRVAVLNHQTWQRVFGSDTAILGQAIDIEGERFVVVGVAPRGFSGIEASMVDVWVPAASLDRPARNGVPWYKLQDVYIGLIARPNEDTSPAQIDARATLAYRPTYYQDSQADTMRVVTTGPLLRHRGPEEKPQELSIALRMACVSAVVLLIACANTANLLLARAARRRREIAVRLALGVSRARLLAQLLIESCTLALVAALAAIWVANAGGTVLRAQLMPRVRWAEPVLDARVIMVVLSVAVLCGALAGLAPAFASLRTDVAGALKAGTREGTWQRSRLRSALLVTQAALSVLLLAGAGLFLRSLSNVRSIDPGFAANRLVAAHVYFDDNRRHPELLVEMPALAERLRLAPVVEAASASTGAPMTTFMMWSVTIPGRDSIPALVGRWPEMVAIPPDFFETTGMRLLAGRGFLPSDGPGGPYVSIVNRSLANALWPGEDPLGRCFIYGEKTNPCVTVVGVVDDLRPWRVTDEPTPLYFVPLTQRVGSPNPWTPGVLVVRAAPGRQEDVATLLRQELARAFPTAQPSVRPLAQALHDQYRPWRLGALLFSAFAILALVVAAIGVYGVVSYVFSQRTHELGVRMALGARRGDVLGLVVSSGLRQVGVGVVLGLAGALAAGRLVESLLYGISARDPVSLVAAPVALLLVGIAATLPAAWRAMRVDPVTVLRDE